MEKFKFYHSGVPGGSDVKDREKRIFDLGIRNRLVTYAYPFHAKLVFQAIAEMKASKKDSE